MKKVKIAAALALALSSIVATSTAHATVIDTVTYYFANGGLYNGAVLKDTSYFAMATFTNATEGTGQNKVSYVDLVMTVMSGLSVDVGAYVNDWAFNAGNATVSKVSYASGIQANNSTTSILAGDKNFGGAPGGNFDLIFNFDTSNPGQLAAGKSSEYKIYGSGLTASSFTILGSGDVYDAAVHVQGMSSPSSFFYGKTTVPPVTPVPPASVPEPTTVALLGLGLLGFAASRRKSANTKNA